MNCKLRPDQPRGALQHKHQLRVGQKVVSDAVALVVDLPHSHEKRRQMLHHERVGGAVVVQRLKIGRELDHFRRLIVVVRRVIVRDAVAKRVVLKTMAGAVCRLITVVVAFVRRPVPNDNERVV